MSDLTVNTLIENIKLYLNKPIEMTLDGIKSEHIVDNGRTGWWEEYRFAIKQALGTHAVLIIRCFNHDSTEKFLYGNVSLWNLHHDKDHKREDLFELIDQDSDLMDLAMKIAKKYNMCNSTLGFIEFKLNQEFIFKQMESRLEIASIESDQEYITLTFRNNTEMEEELNLIYTYDLKNRTFFEPKATTKSVYRGKHILTL